MSTCVHTAGGIVKAVAINNVMLHSGERCKQLERAKMAI